MLTPAQQNQSVPILLGHGYHALTVGSSVNNVEYIPSYSSMDISSGVGFSILIDIVDEDIDVAINLTGGPTETNVLLKINGVTVRVLSGSYIRPTGKVGGVLNAVISVADISLVPTDATVDFSITIRTATGTKTVKYMVDGILVGRNYTQRFLSGSFVGPDDELNISAIEKINDVLDLSPRRPEILYDPSRTTINLPTTRTEGDYIVDTGGQPIIPTLLALGGLTMHFALTYAYGKLGFGVATNIPNFRIARLDISIEGTYHSSVSQYINYFDPIIFAEANKIYVIDADLYIPAGVNSKTLGPDKHYSLSDIKPARPSKNAVLVTYEYNQGSWEDDEETGTIVETEITDETVDESGDPFDESYTEVITSTTYIEVTNSLDPETVLSTYELFRSVRTFANVKDPDTAELTRKEVSKEETVIYYEGDLVIGYSKTVWGLLLAGSSTGTSLSIPTTSSSGFDYDTYTVSPSPALVPVTTEHNTIYWITDPLNMNSMIQVSNVTRTEGLIYKSGEAETIVDPITGGEREIFRKWPILVAQSSGVIDDEGSREWGAIATTRETLLRIRRNQSKASVTIIDHLNNTVKTSFTSGKVQSRDAGATDDPARKTKTMLLRDFTSEGEIGPRAPESLSIQGLERTEALVLGQRILTRFQNAKFQRPVELVGVEFSVRQGATFRVQERDGTLTEVFVTGFSINFGNLGSDGHNISMSLDTVKLLTR